jgi:hypothetical protein
MRERNGKQLKLEFRLEVFELDSSKFRVHSLAEGSCDAEEIRTTLHLLHFSSTPSRSGTQALPGCCFLGVMFT